MLFLFDSACAVVIFVPKLSTLQEPIIYHRVFKVKRQAESEKSQLTPCQWEIDVIIWKQLSIHRCYYHGSVTPQFLVQGGHEPHYWPGYTAVLEHMHSFPWDAPASHEWWTQPGRVGSGVILGGGRPITYTACNSIKMSFFLLYLEF